jgi:hypothetical protein
MHNSVTSIIIDIYETDKTHRHHSKPPLIMNIQVQHKKSPTVQTVITLDWGLVNNSVINISSL